MCDFDIFILIDSAILNKVATSRLGASRHAQNLLVTLEEQAWQRNGAEAQCRRMVLSQPVRGSLPRQVQVCDIPLGLR